MQLHIRSGTTKASVGRVGLVGLVGLVGRVGRVDLVGPVHTVLYMSTWGTNTSQNWHGRSILVCLFRSIFEFN